jgi:tetratricopeptide (TPR) repeat protein
VVVVLLGGGGYYWWSNKQPVSSQETTRRVDLAPNAGQSERDREKLRKQIEQDIGATPTEEIPEVAADDGFSVEEDPEPIPVPPKDRGKRASSPGDPNASLPPPGSDSASSDIADGEAAFQRRDYRAAASAFRRAVDKAPRNATYNGRLGAALARAGDSDSAMSHLLVASKGGYTPALVYLGDLAQQTKDTAGAVGYYQSYLATDPPDARAIQVKLDRLLGG